MTNKNPVPTWEEFDASIDVVKNEYMLKNWNNLLERDFFCVVQNAANYANCGGLAYPLPEGMSPGTLLLIEPISIIGGTESEPYYLCYVTFKGVRRNARLSKYGGNPTARLSLGGDDKQPH